MAILEKIKKVFNNNNSQSEKKEECKAMEQIDNTMIDADKRIKRMLEEMRIQQA